MITKDEIITFALFLVGTALGVALTQMVVRAYEAFL